ncbi:hypothetical protein PoB_004388100 [Plakobranchus ocellatus]|uniref:Mutator-like transposase domain-containing protein n=1 Tax=Plakobranchus ocellatus TaxID=259542 RepID=A0AAV4BAD4_9GAST|nr:hypothetical protein PoB_004388100 [Plakobranchus ocellatus]
MSVSHPLLKIFKATLLELHNQGGKIYDTNLRLVPFCRTLEDILRLGLNTNHGHWFSKSDYWTLFNKFGEKAGAGTYHLIKYVKDNQKQPEVLPTQESLPTLDEEYTFSLTEQKFAHFGQETNETHNPDVTRTIVDLQQIDLLVKHICCPECCNKAYGHARPAPLFIQQACNDIYDERDTLADSVSATALEIINEAYKDNERDEDRCMQIAVSFDGSWLTRGHKSMVGIGCVVEVLTGLVLDSHVMSQHCQKRRERSLRRPTPCG